MSQALRSPLSEPIVLIIINSYLNFLSLRASLTWQLHTTVGPKSRMALTSMPSTLASHTTALAVCRSIGVRQFTYSDADVATFKGGVLVTG